MPVSTPVPKYRELWREDMRGGVAWGVFGEADQLGTMNFIQPEDVIAAASLVKTGKVFPLGLSQNYFEPPLSERRGNAVQTLLEGPISLDDRYDEFYPQASSQWDALKHYGHPKYGFYNGNARETILSQPENLAIGRLAERGIAARGVLLDLGRYRQSIGRPIDCASDQVFSLADIQGCLALENEELKRGDIALVRTGWLEYWERTGSSLERNGPPHCPGLENSPDIAEYFWDHQVAAVVGDNRALEASPGPGGRTLHIYMMTYLGMWIGEFWNFEQLADDCASDGRYAFMVCSSPLNLPGGCGSPANAVALK